MNKDQPPLDNGLLVVGFTLGVVVGGVFALFKAPGTGRRLRQQIADSGGNLRKQIESVVPSDPVAESLAEGKAAARRRRDELGLPSAT
jgi:gas vesicle protein